MHSTRAPGLLASSACSSGAMASRMLGAAQLRQKPRCTFGVCQPTCRRGGCATRAICSPKPALDQVAALALVKASFDALRTGVHSQTCWQSQCAEDKQH